MNKQTAFHGIAHIAMGIILAISGLHISNLQGIIEQSEFICSNIIDPAYHHEMGSHGHDTDKDLGHEHIIVDTSGSKG